MEIKWKQIKLKKLTFIILVKLLFQTEYTFVS